MFSDEWPEYDQKDVEIEGYQLKLTCQACPEQYDVFKDGTQVAYLRLRHGRFRATVPDVGGEDVYEASPEGDGCFVYEEREHYLKQAITHIKAYYGEGLLDCPLCSGKASWQNFNEYIGCNSCSCKLDRDYKSMEELEKEWNTRDVRRRDK
jgi:hypothetical protein